jgi:TPR repeat protein
VGSAPDQLTYGCCLAESLGVGKGLRRARDYFKMAAGQGLPDAMFNYALCLLTGRCGVEKDLPLGG